MGVAGKVVKQVAKLVTEPTGQSQYAKAYLPNVGGGCARIPGISEVVYPLGVLKWTQ